MTRRLVFLVPGFFGFTSVGAVSYFEDVEQALGRGLRRRGIAARIVRCTTQPTASIPRRADALRRQVLENGALKARELHFVGHSTGGLDVRLLLTPGVRIASGDSEEHIARLTRTAISVSTPNHGTPLANHFITAQGQTLLLVLSALATSGQGRGAILAAAKAIALVAQLDDWLGRRETPLDRLAAGVLRKIRFNRRNPVWKYLGEIEQDQGAVMQLTPEGIALFDAAVADRAGIDYSCMAVCCTSRVPITSTWSGITRWWAERAGTGCPRARALHAKHSTRRGSRLRGRSRAQRHKTHAWPAGSWEHRSRSHCHASLPIAPVSDTPWRTPSVHKGIPFGK